MNFHYQRFISTSLTGILITANPLASLPVPSELTRGGLDSKDTYLTQVFDIKTVDNSIKSIRMAQGFGAMKGRTPATGGGDRTGRQ